jgi:hypothetical protein
MLYEKLRVESGPTSSDVRFLQEDIKQKIIACKRDYSFISVRFKI